MRADIMKSYVPIELRDIEPLSSIYLSEGTEFDNLLSSIETVLGCMFVNLATGQGLEYWEHFLGITTNPTLSDETRRGNILSKLRGTGTTTVTMVQNVADSYQNGTVEIIEDAPNYKVFIKFVNVIGLPPNLAAFQNAISSIMPAHLQIEYQFTFNTYADLATKTHAILSTKSHEQLRSSNLP